MSFSSKELKKEKWVLAYAVQMKAFAALSTDHDLWKVIPRGSISSIIFQVCRPMTWPVRGDTENF